MPSPFVRPDVRAFLDIMAANPRPPFGDAMIAAIRPLSPEAMASGDLPVGEMAVIRDLQMPGPGGPLTLRLFDPRLERGPGPAIVFYHGGGFVVGGVASHAGLTAEIARGLDLPVISVEYRLAPEHPWPAAPDDAEAAARWIAANGEAFGRVFTGLVLCGDSAGGNLAIVTALALRETPAASPVRMLWPIYPVTDLAGEVAGAYESGRLFADGYGLAAGNSAYFQQAYAAAADSWRAAPALADPAGLPPMLMVTAGLDPLRDQGRAFAAKAVEAGVDVTYREYAGTIHGFLTYRAGIPSARADLAEMIAAAAGMLAI